MILLNKDKAIRLLPFSLAYRNALSSDILEGLSCDRKKSTSLFHCSIPLSRMFPSRRLDRSTSSYRSSCKSCIGHLVVLLSPANREYLYCDLLCGNCFAVQPIQISCRLEIALRVSLGVHEIDHFIERN